MKKILKSGFIIMVITIILLPNIVYAVPEKPPGESNMSPGEQSTTSISYVGETTLSSDTIEKEKSFSSSVSNKNALLVSGGNSTITNCNVTKTGDSTGDNADFYGTNAAILTHNGAILNIDGGTITTNGSHANAVFAYSNGIINIKNATINTNGNNSGGVMVTGGGTLTADNCNVKTLGNSSASIRSDRGGGNLTVNGGTYETNGVGSPAVYSTANITVNNAILTSNASEGLVIEGANSITINNTIVTDTNTTLNGNSQTYKNVFLYQSMSGDATSGNAVFNSKNSTLITNKGDTIFVTNTIATINLENTTITNNDGDFLRIQTGKWGNSGNNGGDVTLNMSNQKVNCNIIVDNISTLIINMSSNSILMSSIDNENQAKKVSLKMSKDSIFSLTDDTYIDELDNEDSSNNNIYSNGKYKLYVNGSEVSINSDEYNQSDEISISTNNEEKLTKENNKTIYIVISVIIVSIIAFIIIFFKRKNSKKVS